MANKLVAKILDTEVFSKYSIAEKENLEFCSDNNSMNVSLLFLDSYEPHR